MIVTQPAAIITSASAQGQTLGYETHRHVCAPIRCSVIKVCPSRISSQTCQVRAHAVLLFKVNVRVLFLGTQKTALVTGASSGIGKALAFFLADKGWAIFAGVRKETDGAMLREYSSNIRPIILDVVEPESVTRAIEEVRVGVGSAGLDVLVNCAGLACTGPIEFSPEADIMKNFNVNVFGLLRVTQMAMPLIRMGTPGRVINIGSIGSEASTPFLGIYQATKSAIYTTSEVLRREVARSGSSFSDVTFVLTVASSQVSRLS